MILRGSRVLAVARRDLRQRTGKRWYRLPATALALLLPASALSIHLAAPDATKIETSSGQHLPAVAGVIPKALEGRLTYGEPTDVTLSGDNPVVARGVRIPKAIRAELNTLPGSERVAVKRYRPPIRLPGRSLLIALLAISLLTGPLAETLPGERSRHTLEVLLSAGISREELIGGKWLAWTAASTSTAWIAAAAAVIAGVQPAGLWFFGLPLAIGTGVALGLWLVRGVGDIVGGAATPMRVLPVVSMAMGGLAYAALSVHPFAAAAVPLGGALMVAGDVLSDPASVIAAALATAFWVGLMLKATSFSIDGYNDGGSARIPGALGVSAAASVAWGLAVAGPGVWTGAGNPGAAGSLALSVGAGGLVLACVALVAAGRSGGLGFRTEATGLLQGSGLALAILLVAVGLFSVVPAGAALPFQSTADSSNPYLARLAVGLQPLGANNSAAALAAIIGQALLFFGIVARRSGPLVAVVTFTLIVGLANPILAIVFASAAAAAWTRGGTLAAFIALVLASGLPFPS
jgi:hypothetical protein